MKRLFVLILGDKMETERRDISWDEFLKGVDFLAESITENNTSGSKKFIFNGDFRGLTATALSKKLDMCIWGEDLYESINHIGCHQELTKKIIVVCDIFDKNRFIWKLNELGFECYSWITQNGTTKNITAVERIDEDVIVSFPTYYHWNPPKQLKDKFKKPKHGKWDWLDYKREIINRNRDPEEVRQSDIYLKKGIPKPGNSFSSKTKKEERQYVCNNCGKAHDRKKKICGCGGGVGPRKNVNGGGKGDGPKYINNGLKRY